MPLHGYGGKEKVEGGFATSSLVPREMNRKEYEIDKYTSYNRYAISQAVGLFASKCVTPAVPLHAYGNLSDAVL